MNGVPYSEEDIREISRLWREGAACADIARKFSRKERSIRDAVSRWGVRRSPQYLHVARGGIPARPLTEAAIVSIRESALPDTILAREFGMHARHLRRLRNGETWKYV